MITIVYSTHKNQEYNNKFKQHLLQSVGVKDVQILEYVNHNQYSLAQVYNSGITESIYDIVVCCHNDIKLEKNWGKKLLEDFSNNNDFSIIGKAGSCYFPKSGVYWEKMHQTMVGQVYHHPEGQKKWINRYSVKLPYLIPVVTIDGLFISFDKTKIKHQFDETIGKFHFYDHGFCLPNYLDGVKLGVTSSFEITHESVGQPNQEFWESKEKFVEKWRDKLPLDLKPSEVYVPIIKEKPLKNIGKVAVIIPTKGKVDMLYDCVKSLYDNCNSNLFDVFIADTGSTDDEKNQIKSQILPLGNVNLIEYDYYNFAKINNDVVKNHINDDYEFLLFCNNDIKILNNVIYHMLKVFKTKKNVGTVGARLHFENNTLQHDGVNIIVNVNKKSVITTHLKKDSYYNYEINEKEVAGNTSGLMMIRKNVFNKFDGFNDSFRHCFEDVYLNLLLITKNYININLGYCVAYHYESQSRDIDKTETEMIEDYNNILLRFITEKENFEKIKKYILTEN
jgi:GT2 family glycosyltransferase